MNYMPKFSKSYSTKNMSLLENKINASNNSISKNNLLQKYLTSNSIHDKEYMFNNMRYLEGSHAKIDDSNRNAMDLIDKNRFQTIQ